MSHTENENKVQVTDLIAWAKHVQEWEASSVKESLTETFEGWLHTDLASGTSDRATVLFNVNLAKKGISLISKLQLEDLEAAEQLLNLPSNV